MAGRTGEPVHYEGQFWQLDGITVRPAPKQSPMPLWIGGNSEAAARRAGRLGDGWIPSFIAPEQLESGIKVTLEHAERASIRFEQEVLADKPARVRQTLWNCGFADIKRGRGVSAPLATDDNGTRALQSSATIAIEVAIGESFARQ